MTPPPVEEPLPGSVVLDRDGDAWQQRSDGWYPASRMDVPLAFVALEGEYGPLRLLHEPDQDDT